MFDHVVRDVETKQSIGWENFSWNLLELIVVCYDCF